MARRDWQPLEHKVSKRVLKELRACGPFTDVGPDHPLRKDKPTARVYKAVAKPARRMSWGKYENRAPLLVVPACPEGPNPSPEATTYDIAHHLPSPIPEDWQLVHKDDHSAHYRGDDFGIIMLLQTSGDIYTLGVGVYRSMAMSRCPT